MKNEQQVARLYTAVYPANNLVGSVDRLQAFVNEDTKQDFAQEACFIA